MGQKTIDKVIEIKLSRDKVLETIRLRENNLQQVQSSLSYLLKAINNNQTYEIFTKKSQEVIEN
ncbi:MAG: hypothetical protein RM338_29285 [Nostoc sp. DedQUE12a]|nr:hypothetical protein [Nostoc sp. DedQUE12a]